VDDHPHRNPERCGLTILNTQQRATVGESIFGGAPPHNIEAEQCLLGAILINNEAFAHAEPHVGADDFFERIHRQIFEACAVLIGAGKLASPVTLKTFLPADLDIEGMKLGQYLARLAAEATTIINAPHYAKIVRDLANRRRMIDVSEDCIAALKAAPVEITPDAIVADTIERLDEIATGRVPPSLRSVNIGDAGRAALDQLSTRMQGGGIAGGMTWGLAELDGCTDGIHRGELSILAGRPGMCKSGLGAHVAIAAASAGYWVRFWSGEMTAEALGQRALTAIAYKISGKRIAYSDLRSGRNVTDRDYELLRDAYDYFRVLPVIIDAQPSLTIAQIAMRVRRQKQKVGLDLLVLDHLHKIKAADRYRGDPTAEIGEISNACAILAKELNIGVLALCQLSRATESREDKRPQLSDLRQSGSLEQDADVVLFPYREAYYLLAREPAPGGVEYFAWRDKLAACKDRLEINIAKQRQGVTGIIACFTAIECNAFCSLPSDSGAQRSEAAA
jgi:replicative DNA helicase